MKKEFNLSDGLPNQKHSDNPIIDNILQKRAMDEFNLSENGEQHGGHEDSYICYSQEDVKEFIKRLKAHNKFTTNKGKSNGKFIIISIEDLDKLAGEELVKWKKYYGY